VPGVGLSQGPFEVLDHPRVDGRRLQPLVPEEFLDMAHVGAAAKEVCGAVVPQSVGRKRLLLG
jgi:hypothetical protein